MLMYKRYFSPQRAFTIVELLIVIVIIAILAAITVVAYNGVQARAVKTALQSDLRNAATKVALDKAEKGTYPTTQAGALALFTPSAGTYYEYSTPDGGATYLMTITSDKAGAPAYCQKSDGSLTEGACPGHSASPPAPIALMQTVTTANCPTTRTVYADARDNHTYWVQKLGGKCWMLTNLAYAGGGTNTYGDVKTIVNGEAEERTFTAPRFYVPPGANATTNPAQPSTSTDGTGQYGYLYNYCAAWGAQTGTSACIDGTSPAANTSVSICPAGWRLPTGTYSGELAALATLVNGGTPNPSNDSTLRTGALFQRSGLRGWLSLGFDNQGVVGILWSSSTGSAQYGQGMDYSANATTQTNQYKPHGYAVRCVAV